jgi:hypothetical protein
VNYKGCTDNLKKNILTTLLGQSGEKYFDYFDYARGLNINSLRSAEAHTQDLRFRRHQQRDDPNSARGSTIASPPIVIVILRQKLDYVIVDYSRADHTAPDKS